VLCMPRRHLSHALTVSFVLLAAIGCGSYQTPTAPSVSTPLLPQPPDAPVPQPTAPLPVPAENAIYLAAQPRPADFDKETFVGRYTLEIASRSSSGLRCQQVPEHAKRRTYTADIDPFEDYYAVRLYDATFLRDGSRLGYGCSDRRLDMRGVCHQFILRRDGNERVTVEMVPEDEWRGAELWEVLIHETRLLQLHGLGTGTFRNGRIEAAGAGGVWYGTGLPASDYSACGPGEMVWSFTRR
jgi:hypothetical protein